MEALRKAIFGLGVAIVVTALGVVAQLPPTPKPKPPPGGQAPAAPTNLQATAISSSQINLIWEDNSNNEQGFKIERRTQGGSYSQISQVGANVKSYSDQGLSSNTEYCYRVRAYNADGESAPSNEACATTQGGSTQPPPAGDQDRDGVPDSQDHCPGTPGPVSNSGCPLSSPTSPQPPQITFVGIPSTLTIEVPTDWELGFSDPDGDIILISFEYWIDSEWVNSGEWDPEVQGVKQGTIGVQTVCYQLGIQRTRVTLHDVAGHRTTQEYSFDCVSSDIPPIQLSFVDCALFHALDPELPKYNEAEIINILDAWIKKRSYKDCGVPDDKGMLRVLDMWIKNAIPLD